MPKLPDIVTNAEAAEWRKQMAIHGDNLVFVTHTNEAHLRTLPELRAYFAAKDRKENSEAN
jgi:hypothetical protein